MRYFSPSLFICVRCAFFLLNISKILTLDLLWVAIFCLHSVGWNKVHFEIVLSAHYIVGKLIQGKKEFKKTLKMPYRVLIWMDWWIFANKGLKKIFIEYIYIWIMFLRLVVKKLAVESRKGIEFQGTDFEIEQSRLRLNWRF